MATSATDGPLQGLLKALSFEEHYPGRLNTTDLYTITSLSMSENEQCTPETTCWHFINKITRCDYHARSMKVDQQLKTTQPIGYLQRRRQQIKSSFTNCHPLDVIVAVFLCCDPIAKQDLAKCMWHCKLCIPFIVKNVSSSTVWKWPLRSLISQFQVDRNTTVDRQIIDYPMQQLGFIRIGNLKESKSAFLNGIIGGPEKAHPMFFHRDLQGSTKVRSEIVDGLIEVGWFLPKGASHDRFQESKAFFNLRGDAHHHTEQLRIMLQTMDLLVIFSSTEYLLPRIDSFRIVVGESKAVLLLLMDEHSAEQQTDRIESFLGQFSKYDEDRFEILTFEGMRLAEKLEQITHFIQKMNTTEHDSIDKRFSLNISGNVSIDELNEDNIRNGIDTANKVTKKVSDTLRTMGKSSLLPLQGDVWQQWTKNDLETHRLNSFSKSDQSSDISNYLDRLEEKKMDLRCQQIELCSSAHEAVSLFIQSIFRMNRPSLKVFLRRLKLELDEESRKTLRPYYKKYKELLDERKTSDKKEALRINTDLEKLEDQKLNMSVGVEHLIRELGQMFESCKSQGSDNFPIRLTGFFMDFKQIPEVAAKVMLHGYPIEIMDGDVGFVPEDWITEVLFSVQQHLLHKEQSSIYVISVLGIQSSGKSTLLNTLFGAQFAVSAGRCTKGVFMQIIRISPPLSETLHSDYIVIIDTEGLRSTHMSTERSTQFDNELSCFAIGLADLTIVNLMGENVKYLEENLPVVVHAFLRMDMVGLKPKCIIVHQNVDKSNREKLMEQGRILEAKLNELTAKACDIEGISPHKLFKDIIEFDTSGNTHYIPSLFEGEQPMGPVSIGYSEECNRLRIQILQQCASSSRHLTLSNFANHLKNLWGAIKTDQFVFKFKTTAETQTSLHLDDFYCNLNISLLDDISKLGEEVQVYCDKQTKNKESFGPFVIDLEKKIDIIGSKYRKQLESFIEDPSRMYACYMCQWKDSKLLQFDKELAEAKEGAVKQYKKRFEKFQSKKQRMMEPDMDDVKQTDLKNMIETTKRLNENESDEEFANRLCKKWCMKSGLASNVSKHPEVSFIRRDVEEILLQLFEQDKGKIEHAMKLERPFKEFTQESFEVTNVHYTTCTRVLNMIRLKDDKKELQKIVRIAIDEICKEISTMQTKKTGYAKSLVRRLLLEMKKILERHKSSFSKEFKVDLCIFVSDHIVKQLTDIYIADIKAEEAMQYKEKISFVRALLLNLIKEKKDQINRYCIEIIAEFLLSKILDKTVKEVPRHFQKEPFSFTSKREFVDFLLCQTVIRGDIDTLREYIFDPETALIHMLVECITENDIIQTAEKVFSKLINKLTKTIMHSGQQSDSVQFVNEICIKENIEMTRHVLQVAEILNFPVDLIKSGLQMDVQGKCIESKQKLLKQVQNNEASLKMIIAEHWKKRLGCLEKCPFCNEICEFTTVKHTGRHQATRHRPIGCKRFVKKGTTTVSLNVCTVLVRSDATVELPDKTFYFKEYAKHYPDWSITHNSSESTYLWKWLIANHSDTILEDLRVEIPEAWRKITKKMVIESLRKNSS